MTRVVEGYLGAVIRQQQERFLHRAEGVQQASGEDQQIAWRNRPRTDPGAVERQKRLAGPMKHATPCCNNDESIRELVGVHRQVKRACIEAEFRERFGAIGTKHLKPRPEAASDGGCVLKRGDKLDGVAAGNVLDEPCLQPDISRCPCKKNRTMKAAPAYFGLGEPQSVVGGLEEACQCAAPAAGLVTRISLEDLERPFAWA
ncbi:MAG: hypothetical protein FLDDKLPJ_02345 [Phycisphaerae bacterium]|nr:hypothetical protein [Phycisphaerae bacterium]